MAKKKREAAQAPGAPAWMTTYGDLVTLLMCFFVLLFAFSTIDSKKFQQFMNSFQGGAGVLNEGTSLVEDEYVFDGMPEAITSSSESLGNQSYRAVFIKVNVDEAEEGEVLKAVASNGYTNNPHNFEWSSSNEQVAAVNPEGEIKVKQKTEVMIFAKDKETGVVAVFHLNSEIKNASVPELVNSSDWAKSELQKALNMGLVPESLKNLDMQQPVTRREFAAISVKVYEALSDKSLPSFEGSGPFIDTEDQDVLKAYSAGITNGVGDKLFAPLRSLNREQAATMLTRIYKKVNYDGWSLETDANYPLDYSGVSPFTDDGDISSWAKPSVYFMVKNDIIKGIGNNMFAPKSFIEEAAAMVYADSTREQAIIIGLRMVENLKGVKQ